MTKRTLIISIIALLLIVGGAKALTITGTIDEIKGLFGGGEELGSVQQGGEYKYTHLTGASIATSTEIKSTRGTFGSVIITEDQAGAVTVYDATSTAAVTDGTYSDAIATFEDAQAEGVYTFDTSFYRGLVVNSADGFTFAGSWTITHR